MKNCFLVDFDGTICTNDLGNSLIHKATGTFWGDHVKNMGSLEPRSLVKKNYLIWNQVKLTLDDFTEFLEEMARPRPGFLTWVMECQRRGDSIYVVSAGLESYVRPCIQKFSVGLIPSENIIAVPCAVKGLYRHVRPQVDSILRKPHLTGYGKKVISGHIKKKHPKDRLVVIGDGRSDVLMAERADLIYARRYLAEHLKNLKKPYKAFETFYDITPL